MTRTRHHSHERRAPQEQHPPRDRRETSLFHGTPLWIAIGLVVMTAAVYAGVVRNGFLRWDDSGYITTNPHVMRGLSLDGIRWAFTTGRQSNWHPVTWVSHMMDVQLFGLNAGAHHVVNLLLHLLNTLLLFGLLLRLTGATWRSAFVAALFAIHPMHVESVAWIAERKDVLSTTFLWLTLWAYTDYVKRPSAGRYALTAAAFALGLMAKPMLVTLPFVMLLLDVWPLRRLPREGSRAAAWWPLVREKLPFIALSVVSSVVTFIVQQKGGAVAEVEKLGVSFRFGNAVLAYAGYALKLVWPATLSAYYAYARPMSMVRVGVCALALLGITVAVLRSARTKPWLAVGWLWFLGVLVPVIGLVQVGAQAMADRYTYVPYVGLSILIAWGVADLLAGWKERATVLATAGAIAIVGWCVVTVKQVPVWHDDAALWQHAIEQTGANMVTLDNLAAALQAQRRYTEAAEIYQRSLRLNPSDPKARLGLGLALNSMGQNAAAIEPLAQAVKNDPNDASAHAALGAALAANHRAAEAIAEYRTALRLDPNLPDAHNNLGAALADSGLDQEAIAEYREALRIRPGYAQAHKNLGTALLRRGQPDSAMAHFAEAVRLDPNYALAHYQLAAGYEKAGRMDEAIQHYAETVRIRPDDADARNSLGAALANEGRLEEAIPQFMEALRLKPDNAEARTNLDVAQKMAREASGAKP